MGLLANHIPRKSTSGPYDVITTVLEPFLSTPKLQVLYETPMPSLAPAGGGSSLRGLLQTPLPGCSCWVRAFLDRCHARNLSTKLL